jgi:hypothetical protein
VDDSIKYYAAPLARSDFYAGLTPLAARVYAITLKYPNARRNHYAKIAKMMGRETLNKSACIHSIPLPSHMHTGYQGWYNPVTCTCPRK